MSGTNDCQSDDIKSSEMSANVSPNKSLKSTAIVKYSAVPTPATFAQLQCNTDLNLPPSNWLSSSAQSYGLQNVWSQNSDFASFRMAHMFPDCVGEVDVVSDAENIKKLLKIPYSRGVISMMVHRIENTLLLDDFDIHKYLMRQAEDEWKWLKEFFSEYISRDMGNKEKKLYQKVNSRDALQRRNLISKFLYYTLASAKQQEGIEKPTLPIQKVDRELPEPPEKEKLPDPNCNHNFTRNIVWTFENIQMLIGTDMPIFGGQTHPCISLRLRDMTKPINVLTGIDYWLDNLMCNVPEVVMCYHLDGIVQKYELIKTEDLPNVENAKFSPKVIRDVAQNILSFLKNNATKAGHTYWLFKGKDDDVVKLYDLTSLCNDVADEKGQNPFTVPVAMLLYRVARNMKYSSDYRQNQGSIRMLLKNCIQLLPKEKYPQIVTSAHYMLSDLYVPEGTDPASPNLHDHSDEDDAQSESSANPDSECGYDEFEEGVSAAIKSLTLARIKDQPEREVFTYKPPSITGTIEERCLAALEHVRNGLACLVYFPTEEESTDKKENQNKEDEEKSAPNMAKPFEAIPMPYEPLKKEDDNASSDNSSPTRSSRKQKQKQKKKRQDSEDKSQKKSESEDSAKALLFKPNTEALPTWKTPKREDNLSWKAHLKILLYDKASLIFAVLAEREYSNKQYGASLRYIYDVLCCQTIWKALCADFKNKKLISHLLGRAGDCCCMVVQDWKNIERHRQEYDTKNSIEEDIIKEVYTLANADSSWMDVIPQNIETLESMMVSSYKCYDTALQLETSDAEKRNLLVRLGNIHNELGVLYMNYGGSKYQQQAETTEESKNLDNEKKDADEASVMLDRSMHHLERGVEAFEKAHDEANLALLYSNIGRLMRLRAHTHVKQYSEERNFYNKALSSYQKALQVLGTRKSNPAIWDTVTYEISTTLFTMATLLQDFPIVGSKTEEELEREVVEIFKKALKYCDVETPGPRQPIYQFRAAIIQHKLASLYHRIYRTADPESESTKRKTNLQLCKLHYEKASKLMQSLEQVTEYLTVQMERVALAEYQAQISTTYNAKLKSYQTALEHILQSREMVELLYERLKSAEKVADSKKKSRKKKPESNGDCDNKDDFEEEEKLIPLMEERLQFLLLSLTKLCLNKNNVNHKKEHETLGNVYKQCYGKTLRQGTLPLLDLVKNLCKVLQELEKIIDKLEK